MHYLQAHVDPHKDVSTEAAFEIDEWEIHKIEFFGSPLQYSKRQVRTRREGGMAQGIWLLWVGTPDKKDWYRVGVGVEDNMQGVKRGGPPLWIFILAEFSTYRYCSGKAEDLQLVLGMLDWLKR